MANVHEGVRVDFTDVPSPHSVEIGLVMAGANSAIPKIAAVLDCPIEILDAWASEKARITDPEVTDSATSP
ncbi:hypothetical protein [Pseudomonas akapageensis]|uniref:hypothetical protein n=1 Tax=Pseudomonas akapageensis TaxID=2609961 RepID=UPI00140D9906|nr:hypothetical protein [Pseudomonas akapageensis]